LAKLVLQGTFDLRIFFEEAFLLGTQCSGEKGDSSEGRVEEGKGLSGDRETGLGRSTHSGK